MTKGKKSY